MGPVGFSAIQYILNGMRCRATASSDFLHLMHGCVVTATTLSGLSAVRFEYIQVCKLRKGPFRPGGKNCAVMRAAAKKFFELNDEKSIIFGYIYEELVA
eukprot:2082037-Pyramimonas_sp.AAC.1